MTLEGSDLMLIVGGVLVLLVMVVGGFSFLIRHKRKIYESIQEDDKRLQDDLVNNSQHPGRFPH